MRMTSSRVNHLLIWAESKPSSIKFRIMGFTSLIIIIFIFIFIFLSHINCKLVCIDFQFLKGNIVSLIDLVNQSMYLNT